MGYDERRLTVVGKVSRHNSPRDTVDDAKWKALHDAISKLIYQSSYSDLWSSLDITLAGDYGD